MIFPHELQAGVTLTRDYTADPTEAPPDTEDEYRFQVLQQQTYWFSIAGTGLPALRRDLAALADRRRGQPVAFGPQGDGSIILADLPPGTYVLHVGDWTPDQSAGVVVPADDQLIGTADNPQPLVDGPSPVRLDDPARHAGSSDPRRHGRRPPATDAGSGAVRTAVDRPRPGRPRPHRPAAAGRGAGSPAAAATSGSGGRRAEPASTHRAGRDARRGARRGAQPGASAAIGRRSRRPGRSMRADSRRTGRSSSSRWGSGRSAARGSRRGTAAGRGGDRVVASRRRRPPPDLARDRGSPRPAGSERARRRSRRAARRPVAERAGEGRSRRGRRLPSSPRTRLRKTSTPRRPGDATAGRSPEPAPDNLGAARHAAGPGPPRDRGAGRGSRAAAVAAARPDEAAAAAEAPEGDREVLDRVARHRRGGGGRVRPARRRSRVKAGSRPGDAPSPRGRPRAFTWQRARRLRGAIGARRRRSPLGR